MSPTVMRREGLRFFFYSDERAEPPHIHVAAGGNAVKFWLGPVELARNRGFAAHDVNRIRGIIVENREYLWEVWYEVFDSQR